MTLASPVSTLNQSGHPGISINFPKYSAPDFEMARVMRPYIVAGIDVSSGFIIVTLFFDAL